MSVLAPPVPGTAEPGPSPAVVLDDVAVRFGDNAALDGVSFTLPRGRILGLVGPSGSGKSTLIRVVLGLVRPTDGQVLVDGHDPACRSIDEARTIGYLPQSPALFPNLSLWANLSFVASLYGVRGRRRRRAHLHDLLRFVGLDEHRRTRLADASGGMQRRLALAAALVHDPALLVLDEPTAGLDPLLRQRLWERFRALRDSGHTLLVSTQYVGEAAECDAVAVLADGRLIALDEPEALRRAAMGGEVVVVAAEPQDVPTVVRRLRTIDEIVALQPRPDGLEVVVHDATATIPVIADATADLTNVRVELPAPDYDEVFVRLVHRHARAAARAG